MKYDYPPPGGVVVRDSSRERAYFTMTPNVIWGKELTPYEFTLYSFYKKVAGDDGECWYSQEKIGEITRMSQSHVSRATKSLLHKGLITKGKKETESGHKVNVITIVDIWPQVEYATGIKNIPQEYFLAPGAYKEYPKEDIEEEKKKTTRQTTPGLAELRQRWIEESGYWSGNNPGKNEYGRLGKELKDLLGDGYSSDDILGCLSWAKGWASAQLWPSSIEKQIAKWIQDGKPGADGYVEKDRNRYIKGELADYIRH